MYLRLGRREVARVVADARWPRMWRVHFPDGWLSDMVNRVRAKDAALTLAAAHLHRAPDMQETARGGAGARLAEEAAP
jgi:hypothetical protein